MMLPDVNLLVYAVDETSPFHGPARTWWDRTSGVGSDLTTDAHIAAYAIERGATVYSNDRDFGRFEGLRWNNPLA